MFNVMWVAGQMKDYSYIVESWDLGGQRWTS